MKSPQCESQYFTYDDNAELFEVHKQLEYQSFAYELKIAPWFE